MNERIQQLVEQATTKISFRLDPNTYKHIDDPEGDFERVEFDKQKFAELIVREYSYDIMNLHGASPERIEMAAKHWGVQL